MRRAYRELRGVVTLPLLASFLLFGTMPLWIEAVGLYQYIGLEIMIWVIFALGYNLLLGYAGLPSFGHGAFLGIGAYAFGLTQFNLAENLWISLLGAVLVTAALGGVVALFISHRRGIYYALMTIAFGQIFFFVASKWTTVTGGEDGLLDIQRLPVDLGLRELRHHRDVLARLVRLRALRRRRRAPVAAGQRAVRQGPQSDQAERGALHLPRLQRGVLQVGRLHHLLRCRRARRRAVRHGPAGRLHPDHEPAMVGHRSF